MIRFTSKFSFVIATSVILFMTNGIRDGFCLSEKEAKQIGIKASEARLSEAKKYFMKHEYDKAVETLSKKWDKNYLNSVYGPEYHGTIHSYPLEYALEGSCLLEMGKLEKAQNVLALCTGFFPEYSGCYYGLGSVFKQKGNKTAALMYFNRALELSHMEEEKKAIEEEIKSLK